MPGRFSLLVIAIEPFAIPSGFGTFAMLLSLFKSQAALNNAVALVEMWSVKADDFVSHGCGEVIER